jgi:CubicO group peptidase (beta-lactamase class C family)
MKTYKYLSASYLLAIIFAGAIALSAQPRKTPDESRPIGPVLEQIDHYVERGMDITGVPGVAVAIVYRDKVVYLKGFGVRKAGQRARVDADTVFQLASLSKSIASTVIASLVGTQEVSWDSRIADLDRSFKLYDEDVTNLLTIRDLLSHRSGLPTSSGDLLEDLGFTRPEILHQMRLVRPTGTFRKTYQYSNFPFTEAGIAAAKAVHRQWENVAEERLFKPLGMMSASYRYSDYKDRINKAAIHVFVDGTAVARYKRDPDAEAPAGSASSSVRDMAEWLRLQLGGGTWNGEPIVAADALKETHTPQIQINTDPNGAPVYYGLGWNISSDPNGKPMLDHRGAFVLGAGTNVSFSPSDQLGIVVLTNAQPTGLAEAITLTLFDLYRYGKSSRDWLSLYHDSFRQGLEDLNNASKNYSTSTPPTSPAPPKPFTTYLGTYRNNYYGQIEVTEEHGMLWMRLPSTSGLYSLNHWDGNTFTYRYYGDLDLARGVQFKFDGMPRVLVENLALEGDGEFIRSEQ